MQFSGLGQGREAGRRCAARGRVGVGDPSVSGRRSHDGCPTRRQVLSLSASYLALALGGAVWPAGSAAAVDGRPAARPFSHKVVKDEARRLAAAKFAAPKPVSQRLIDLKYPAYRTIRFNKEAAVWRRDKTRFTVELFPPGSVFTVPVDVDIVNRGGARPLEFDPDYFDWGKAKLEKDDFRQAGFSGFRVHAPINRPDYYDEFMVFQGASYFRAVARGQAYGLSARGLALRTADPKGEEFPVFTRFWIERPAADVDAIVCHALLDSPSVAGAYRFGIYPGRDTVMDVSMTLYPRVDLDHVGIGPMTSMFLFGWIDRSRVDDFRPEVHDSDGLAIWTGGGERLWRPLSNPAMLQISAFVDDSPRGFGVMQRNRNPADYQDLEAHYERRPSLWVEPVGKWGKGHVELVEIPSPAEIHDNIVAYWRPDALIPAGSELSLDYRLHWCWTPPIPTSEALVTASRSGLRPKFDAESEARDENTRLFVIDFAGGPLPGMENAADVKVMVTASQGEVSNVVGRLNPVTKGYRASFDLKTDRIDLSELRLVLTRNDKPVSETWLYRWTR